MTVLPVDMQAVCEYGLERWSREAWWPVHYGEIHALSLAVISACTEAARKLETEWSDCIWSDIRYGGYIAQRVHAIVVQARAEAAGGAIDARGDGISLYLPDYEKEAAIFRAQMSPSDRVGTTIRDARRRWLGNSHLSWSRRLGSMVARPSIWNIGAKNVLKDAYLTHKAAACDFPNPADWPRSASSFEIPPVVRRALNVALNEITEVFPDLTLSTHDRIGLVDLWCARLEQIRAFYDAVIKYPVTPQVLLWGSQGNSAFRTVAHAFRRRGVRIVGFQHGHNPVWVQHPHIALNEVRGCDEFVCGTAGQANAYRRMILHSGIANQEKTTVSSVDIDLYDRWRATRPARRPVKRVLMPGFPGLARAYLYDWTGFALMRTPLEIHVARALRSAGYKVVYKPHPETAEFMGRIMQPFVDEVALGPFEDAVEGVDAAVYLYPFSTTFPYVLLRNLPVLLVDVEGRDWLPNVLALLSKRCAVATASLGPGNRIVIDDQRIIEGMKQAEGLEDEALAGSFFSA